MPVPYWSCEICQARLYSASEALRWKDCPVCEGNLVKLHDHPSGQSGGDPGKSGRRPGPATADGR